MVGVTTNPTIFQKAISSERRATTSRSRTSPPAASTVEEALRMITTSDVRDAADVLRPVYDATGGQDGRVSIEVDPRLAHNTEATIAEARSWPGWWTGRTRFIKIPATKAGLPAITDVPSARASASTSR